MAQFMGDVVFLLEVCLVTLGLIVFHFGREQKAVLLRAAGIVLVVGAALTAVCTTYYWMTYAGQGDFAHAHLVVQSAKPPSSR